MASQPFWPCLKLFCDSICKTLIQPQKCNQQTCSLDLSIFFFFFCIWKNRQVLFLVELQLWREVLKNLLCLTLSPCWYVDISFEVDQLPIWFIQFSKNKRKLYRWVLFYACATSTLSLENSFNKRRNRANLALNFIRMILCWKGFKQRKALISLS